MFLFEEHRTPSNLSAWREGLAALNREDVPALLSALERSHGKALRAGPRGGKARHAASKFIERAISDPASLLRLREAEPPLFSDEKEAALPYSVSLLALVWSLKPHLLPALARQWRLTHRESGQHWRNPFLFRPGMGGPPEIATALHGPTKNLLWGADRLDTEAPQARHFKNPLRAEEARHLFSALQEISGGCIDELWASEARVISEIQAGKRTYRNHSSHWGFLWFGMDASLTPPGDRVGPSSVDLLLSEAQSVSSEALSARARELLLSAAGGWRSATPIALRFWAQHRPAGSLALPLLPTDWLSVNEMSSLFRSAQAQGFSAHEMGAWLASGPAAWAAPADFHPSRGTLIEVAPSFIGHRDGLQSISEPRWPDLTLIDWLALGVWPEAALAAIHQGAKLSAGFAQAFAEFERSERDTFPTSGRLQSLSRDEFLSIGQACLLADESAPARASSRSRLSL